MNQQRVPPTLLLIDDITESRNGFKAKLAELGYHVVTAHDAENARTVSLIYAPDLILMSLEIPPSDYLVTAHRIRHQCSPGPNVPVV